MQRDFRLAAAQSPLLANFEVWAWGLLRESEFLFHSKLVCYISESGENYSWSSVNFYTDWNKVNERNSW